ncbi:Fc receptor-like protein 5 [Pyxicephalus adspersus]
MDIHQQNFTVQSTSEVYNGGDYQCRTRTSDISDPVKLHVSSNYVVLQTPPNIYEGDSLTLRCYSPPGYNGTNTTFYKDGKEIQFSVNVSEFHIDKVDRSVTGTYSCTKTVQFYDAGYVNRSDETYVDVKGFDGDEIKPMVTFTPNWRSILSMDSMTLTCNVRSARQERETIYWYRYGKLIHFNQQNITIQSAHWRNDSGYYQCRTSTSDISEPVTLEVTRRDLILQRPTSIYEGDPLTLRCLSRTSFLVINTTFYKNDKRIKFSIFDTELHIKKVDKSVTGMYKCVQQLQSKIPGLNGNLVSHKMLYAISYITIRARIRPVVTFSPSWGTLLSGDSVTLTCEAGSAVKDNQTYYWYKGGKILNITQQSFTIPSASHRHRGGYKCCTKSRDMSLPTRLEVSDADIILQQDSSSAYEETPLTLRCHSRAEYNGIDTTFYKDNKEIQFSANNFMLHIQRLDRRASGNYKCSQLLQRQDGTFSADSAQIYIYVKDITDVTDLPSSGTSDLVQPVVTFTPPWRRIQWGDSVTITCNIDTATPENETFYWYKDEEPMGNHQQNITIQSASEENDNAEYQCRTSTSDFSDPMWLDVTNDEVILQKPPYIHEGDPLTLRCYSSPSWINTTFYKEDEEIDLSFNGSELHFDKVDRNTTGTYRCDKIQHMRLHELNYFLGWISLTFVYVGEDVVKPMVTFTPNRRNILQDDTVTLTCNVASPEQEKEMFYWYRNNQGIINEQQTFTLKYANVMKDSGYYQCRTSTSDISDPVKLEVEEEFLVLQRPTSIYVGDPLTLRCHTRRFLRAVNTTFFKDDKEIFFSLS